MPYRSQYFDAPKDMDLVIHPELPDGYKEKSFFTHFRRAWLEINVFGENESRPFSMYHCHHCNGWVEGEPNSYHVDTLRPERLVGRRGEEYYCRRCGKQIGFIGMMS